MRWRDWGSEGDLEEPEVEARARPAPGKVSSTSRIGNPDAPRYAVSPGKRTLTMSLTRSRAGEPAGGTLFRSASPGAAETRLDEASSNQLRAERGAPLPDADRWSERMGADVSAARVVTGGRAESTASAIDARAFTVGQTMFFGAGAYDPGSEAGQHLIAHELAHTIQQSGSAGSSGELATSTPGDSSEREAHAAADAAMAGGPGPSLTPGRTQLAGDWGGFPFARAGGIVVGPGGPVQVPDNTPRPDKNSTDYLKEFGKRHADELPPRLAEVAFPLASPYVSWKDGSSRAFGDDLGKALGTAAGAGSAADVFKATLAPRNVLELVDKARDADSRDTPKSADEYHEAVTLDLVNAYRERVRDSLDRLIPRYVNEWNRRVLEDVKGKPVGADGKPAENPAGCAPGLTVRTSHPIDSHVLASLGASTGRLIPNFARYRTDFKSEAEVTARREKKPVVAFTWQNQQGASNWIQVTDPVDATVEDVAEKMYGSSEMAYKITAAPPLFGLEPMGLVEEYYLQWSKNGGGTSPELKPGGGAHTLPQQILSGPLASSAALNQARGFAPARNATAAGLAQQFDQILVHFDLLKGEIAKVVEGEDQLDAAKQRVAERKSKAESGDPGEVELWATQAREQLDVLIKALEGIQSVKRLREGLKGEPTGQFEASLQQSHIARIYVRAAGISDMVVTARQMMGEAERETKTFVIQWLEDLFRWLRGAIIASRKSKRTGGDQDPKLGVPDLDKREAEMRRELHRLRELLLTDPEAAKAQIDVVYKKLSEMSVEVSVVRNVDACDEAWKALKGSKSTMGWIRGLAPGEHGNERLESLQGEADRFEADWNKILELYRGNKKEDALDLLDKKSKSPEWKSFFDRVAREIRDQAEYDRWMTFAAMIGIAILSGGLGAIAEAAVGTGTFLGFVVGLTTEVTVFTALSTALIDKDPSVKSFASSWWSNLKVFGALRAVSFVWKLAGGAKGLGEAAIQYAAINGHALYEANQAKIARKQGPLSLGEIIDISLENLAFLIGVSIGNMVVQPVVGKLVLRGKIGASLREVEALQGKVTELAKQVEAAKGKDVEGARRLLERQGELLDKQTKLFEELIEIANNPGKAKEAGVTEAQLKQIREASGKFESARQQLAMTRLFGKLEAVSSGSYLIANDGSIEGARAAFEAQKAHEAKTAAEAAAPDAKGEEAKGPGPAEEATIAAVGEMRAGDKGVRSFTVEMKDGSRLTITERVAPEKAVEQGTNPVPAAPDGGAAKAPEVKVPEGEAAGKEPTAEQAEANHQMALEARRLSEARDAQLMALFLAALTDGHCTRLFGRLIQGGGLAAAMDAATLPGAPKGGGSGKLEALPDVMAVAAGPETWAERGQMRSGQPAGQLDGPGWRMQPSQFTGDQKGYSPSTVIADAAAMTRFDAGLATLRNAVILECSPTRDASWKVDGASVRLRIRVGGKEVYVYARATDFASGPGEGRKLDDGQFGPDPAKRAEYRKTLEGDGRIVLGDGPVGAQKTSGDILVSGGGATGGWNAEMAAGGKSAKVDWVGRDSGKVPTVVDSVGEEYRKNQAELRDPAITPERAKELNERQQFLRVFGDALLPRNTQEGGAFTLKNVKTLVDEIEFVAPSETKDPKIRGKVWVKFKSGTEKYYDQIVLAHGPDVAKTADKGLPGARAISGSLMYRPVVRDGAIVALESVNTNPPGAARVIGIAIWSPTWIPQIAPEYRGAYEFALREQAKAPRIRAGSPDSVGVPGSIHMVGRDIPGANAELARPPGGSTPESPTNRLGDAFDANKGKVDKNDNLPPDVVVDMQNLLPGIAIDPANPGAAIGDYLAMELGIPRAELTVTPLGGGKSGAEVFLVKQNGTTVGIFKIFRTASELAREVSALRMLREANLTKMKPVGIDHAVKTAQPDGSSPDGKKSAGALMGDATRDATFVNDTLEKAGEAKGDARKGLLEKLTREILEVARAMAEMHDKMASGGEVSAKFKESEIFWLRDRWEKIEATGKIARGDLPAIRRALDKLYKEFKSSKLSATVVHGDAHIKQFAVGKDGTVNVIDTETLHRSIDEKTGKGTAPAATDVGRFSESIRQYGQESGLTADEIAQAQQRFLAEYKASSKAAGPDFDVSARFYATNVDTIALRGAIFEGEPGKIESKIGILKSTLGLDAGSPGDKGTP